MADHMHLYNFVKSQLRPDADLQIVLTLLMENLHVAQQAGLADAQTLAQNVANGLTDERGKRVAGVIATKLEELRLLNEASHQSTIHTW